MKTVLNKHYSETLEYSEYGQPTAIVICIMEGQIAIEFEKITTDWE